MLAKWIIRNIAFQHGMLAVFTPKLEEGMAGNGLHIHMELQRDGRNIMRTSDGELSKETLQLIGGMATYAPSLTAFGNTMASSYLRLVPNQEAPTRICWSASNRSALIRVPLGWTKTNDLASTLNSQQDQPYTVDDSVQTIELRSPDGSAIPHLLLAGIATAARWSMRHHDEATAVAESQHVTGNIFTDPTLLKSLPSLPSSCAASASRLVADRHLYEQEGIFPERLIDRIAALLHEEKDHDLAETLAGLSDEERVRRSRQVMHAGLNRR